VHVALTFGSQACERALTFAAVTLLLRALPTSAGGSFVLMLKIAGFTGVLATLGLQAGAVSLISGALEAGRQKWADALLRAFLATRVSMAAFLLLLGLFGHSWIATHLLGIRSAGVYVEWGCISGATNAVLMFSLHHLQARQAFARYTVLTVMTSMAKLIAILLLLTASALTASLAAALWALLPLGGAVAGLFLASRQFLRSPPKEERREARCALSHIGRWLTVSSLLGVVYANLDSLLVARYLGLTAVDWYGAAINLSLAVTVLATSLFTVFLPAVSRLTGLDDIRRFFRRALMFTGAGAVTLLPVIAIAPWLMRIVYGQRFLPAVPAFRFLFVGTLFCIMYAPASVVFIVCRKPIHMAGQTAFQLAASVPFYIILIPRMGVVGGAIGTFAGQAAALIYVAVFGTLILRQPGVGKAAPASSDGHGGKKQRPEHASSAVLVIRPGRHRVTARQRPAGSALPRIMSRGRDQ
jgi:O-antigen/teichoic acid export membrane protein